MLTKHLKRQIRGIKQYLENKYHKIDKIKKKGKDLLDDSLTNKTCAFPENERLNLGLKGLLPDRVLSLSEQEKFMISDFNRGILKFQQQNPSKKMAGVEGHMIRKWKMIQNIKESDITLYYNILKSDFKEFLPIVYTPTVGWICKNFSTVFKKSKGFFVNYSDRKNIQSVLNNSYLDKVQLIVVTDGSKVLGLGDWGVGGISIALGKSDLYVACGGFNPSRILPVVLDLGTDNEELLGDPHYLGIRKKRVGMEEYFEFMDEFMAAVKYKWPGAMVHFEDFQVDYGLKIIQRYKNHHLVYNDCISGTAATILSGILSGLKIQGLDKRNILNLKFVIVGDGNAGMGIVYNLHLFLQNYGLSAKEANQNFFILNSDGLITKKQKNLRKRVIPYAREEQELQGLSLAKVIKKFKPNVLIGTTGTEGIFTKEILESMPTDSKMAPMIFPLSNPTSRSECTAEEAQLYTNHKAIFASGNPFPDVFHKKKKIISNLAQTAFIFPGLARGALLANLEQINDEIIISAAEAVSDFLNEDMFEERRIFPKMENIDEVSIHVAAKVIEKAYEKGLVRNEEVVRELELGVENLERFIRSKLWQPIYRPLVKPNN